MLNLANSKQLTMPKLIWLFSLSLVGKIVSLVAKESAASTGQVHKSIANDVLDGTLDGIAAGTNVSLIDIGLYASVLVELKTVIAGNEPNLDAIRANIPVSSP